MPSIKNFVSRTTPDLVAALLLTHGITLTDGASDSPATIADAIEAELAQRPPGSKSKLCNDIESVEHLATEVGEGAIDSTTISDLIPDLPSRHARVLWLFLNDREGFYRAEECAHHDAQRYGRQWSAFDGPANCELHRDAEAQEAFKARLRTQFDTPNVHLDIFDRSNPASIRAEEDQDRVSLVQITIYREDRPNVEPTFVDSRFTYQERSRVIEAAVSYEPATGRIECVASKGAMREEVVKAFAINMLGSSPEIEPTALRSYDLSVLAERKAFDTDPADNIEMVSVAMLRLVPVDTDSEQVTLERRADSDRDIWAMADDRLGPHALSDSYRIHQARIAIRHRPAGVNRRQTLQVTITHPYKSNIKEQREIERVVASKYLPRWGLVVGDGHAG